MSATRGATAAAPPNLLMLKTCLYAGKQETIIRQAKNTLLLLINYKKETMSEGILVW
jgi:hypothetical protein